MTGRAPALAGAIAALHLVGFGLLLTGPLAAGIGLTAYTLGLRHAFDADHIAAIDNVTRKLVGDGERPLTVGFCFSLGHSTVVFAAAALIAAGVRVIGFGPGSVIGPVVSGTFLIAVGLLNLALLRDLLRGAVAPTGPMQRVLGRVTRAVRRPWHMYPLGLLFGLGFDTATEIALLATAAGAAADRLPVEAILCLPVLFAAGMSLLDTLDGVFMVRAYGLGTVRRRYGIAVTALSVAVALVIGTLELIAVAGGPQVALGVVGYVVVGLFVAAWGLARLRAWVPASAPSPSA